jgi:CheY-like chemotaxis protein
MTNCQIVVVDDDQEDHMILKDYFESIDKTNCLRFFENSRDLFEFLKTVKPDSDLPRLIVLDLNMPILNGTQTLLALKQDSRLRHIPIIIYSTSENETEKRKCLSFGAVDYIVKPTSLEEGESIVKRFSGYLTE